MTHGAPPDVVLAMDHALDEVAAQLFTMEAGELLGAEDLEWSFDGPDGWGLFVEGARGEKSGASILVEVFVFARKGLQHAEERRDVRVEILQP